MNSTVATGLTIVIASHNRPAKLVRAVRSVLRHRAVDELIVVDDASDPPVDLGALADPRLRIVRHGDNRGVSAARNTGTQAARFSHLTYVDDDDMLLPLAGRALRSWIDGTRDRIVVGGVVVVGPGRLPFLRRPPNSRAGEIWGLDTHLLTKGRSFATKQAAVLPRALLDRVGGWDEALRSRETSELFFRLTQIADVEARAWPVYRLDRGPHERLTKGRERRERSVAYIREKHAALFADPSRRAAFEDNHAAMMKLGGS